MIDSLKFEWYLLKFFVDNFKRIHLFIKLFYRYKVSKCILKWLFFVILFYIFVWKFDFTRIHLMNSPNVALTCHRFYIFCIVETLSRHGPFYRLTHFPLAKEPLLIFRKLFVKLCHVFSRSQTASLPATLYFGIERMDVHTRKRL